MPQIFCFGHSITYGRWDTEGGWVQRLREELDETSLQNPEEESFQVWNLGVPGDDSNQLLERFSDEVERRIYEPMEQVVILQIGANDSQYLREDDCIRVSEKKYRENLGELIEEASSYTDHVFLVGELYTTIDGPIPWAEDKAMDDDRLGEYVEFQRDIVEEKKVQLVDLRKQYSREEWLEMLEDGLHPDNRGHKQIMELVKDSLRAKNLV